MRRTKLPLYLAVIFSGLLGPKIGDRDILNRFAKSAPAEREASDKTEAVGVR